MYTPLSAALSYVDICTGSLSDKEFFFILDENVVLNHQTNGKKIDPIKGRANVVDAFSKNIFKNTSKIDVKNIGFNVAGNSIAIHIDVKEEKSTEDGGWVRFHFIERTMITVVQYDKSWRIASINMNVTRESL